MRDHIKRLAALFAGFVGAHGTHGTPEKEPGGLKWNIKRTARTLREPVTDDLWEQHVRGERPLGVIPIREDSTCSWGSIDFDVYDVDLLDVVRRVEEAKLPLVPCVSKSGGLHLFMFLKKPEPAADVQTLLRDAAASLGMAKCEIFPKQTRVLLERNDLGSWIVMPYFGDTYDGKLRMQRGLKRTGAEMTVEEFVVAAEKARTTTVDMAKLCEGRRETSVGKNNKGKNNKGKNNKKRGAGAASPGDFSDGPPCLQHMTKTPMTEGRKRTLFMMALYYKRADPVGWKTLLEQANHRYFKPPLPGEEVLGVVKSVGKHEYEYTCKEEPMCSHCDAKLCRTRRFGVGRGEYPSITSISKLKTTPPIWFVEVDGEARLELTTGELQNYMHFHKACMEKVEKSYKMLRQDVWLTMLGEAMQNVDHLDAPEEISVEGQFKELLEQFLTNRARGTRREDVLSNRPFEDTEVKRHWFRMEALVAFIEKSATRAMRDLPQSKIYQRIVDLGGGRGQFNFKNEKSVRVVWVPSGQFTTHDPIEPEKIVTEEDL